MKTVHPYFLQFRIPLNTSSELELREGLGRFHLELLEKPGIADFLSQALSKLDGELNWNTLDVDIYDSILAKSVQAVAEEVLGIYDVLERRKAPDNINSFLASQVSAMAAIRLFKRKQRNNSR